MRSRFSNWCWHLMWLGLASIGFVLQASAVEVEEGDVLVLLNDNATQPLTRGIYRVDPDAGTWELVLPISLIPAHHDFHSMLAGPDGVLHLLRLRPGRSIVSLDLETGEHDTFDPGDSDPFSFTLDANGDFVLLGVSEKQLASGQSGTLGALIRVDRSTGEKSAITDEAVSRLGRTYLGVDACGHYLTGSSRVSAVTGEQRLLSSEFDIDLQSGTVGITSSGELVVALTPFSRRETTLYVMSYTTGATEIVKRFVDGLSAPYPVKRGIAIGIDDTIFLTSSDAAPSYSGRANSIMSVDPETGESSILTTFGSTASIELIAVVPKKVESRADKIKRKEVCKALRMQLFLEHMEAFSGQVGWHPKGQ